MTKRLIYVSTSLMTPRGAYHWIKLPAGYFGCVITDHADAMRAELASAGAQVWPDMLDQSPLPSKLRAALQDHGVPVTPTDTAYSALRKAHHAIHWPALDPEHF